MSDKLLEEKEIVALERKIGLQKVEEYRAMGVNELERELSKLAKYREEIIIAQKNDEELCALKEKIKFINAPYNDSKKQNALLSKFVYLILNEKGVV